MITLLLSRRALIVAGGSMLAAGVSRFLSPARAQGFAPTASMSGGANNYRKGAKQFCSNLEFDCRRSCLGRKHIALVLA